MIRAYRDQLDRVNQQMFVFQPYNELFPQLPDYCTVDQVIWTARVPLIYFYIIEYYYPDRFCRQFSGFQDVPFEVVYSEELHAFDGRSGNFDWANKHAQHLYCWRQRAGFIHPMQVMNNPITSDAYRVWYHTHGKLFIGNPEHRQDQGYVQCGALLNEAMHYIREMHISTREAREDGARALDLVRELHISSREHLENAGYAYYADVPPHLFNDAPVYEPRVQHRRPDLRRHRENMRGQPRRGGRRMRAVN
ncbi:serine/threonine-protein phosphatase 7 long form homolog [Ipomoea triloba]|uniref:serine/threonine-protein phosphatase 7 long form homolog n=1 Tax=Ipomoea triloba TaxID=35885 RepID=UPI00125E8203|nr:serine/threonine-protein phosphatase 7 long form homolog [Ipomoea triloba]